MELEKEERTKIGALLSGVRTVYTTMVRVRVISALLHLLVGIRSLLLHKLPYHIKVPDHAIMIA